LTGHPDHTALIREVPVAARSQAQLPNAEREAAWRDLSADDAPRAYQAVWKLADDSGAVDFLRTKVRPASPLDEAKLAKLIAELDSPSFAKREAAGKSISELGRIVISNLEQVRAQSHSAEVKTRLQKLIDDLRDHPSIVELGQLRVIHVLELAATPAARDHLKLLAAGAPGARLTEAAAAALKRLPK
jgi:hypothetical protein